MVMKETLFICINAVLTSYQCNKTQKLHVPYLTIGPIGVGSKKLPSFYTQNVLQAMCGHSHLEVTIV